MSFEIIWKQEITEVKEILDDNYLLKWDSQRLAVQIVKKLFGKKDRIKR